MNETNHAIPAFRELTRSWYRAKYRDAWLCLGCGSVNRPREKGRFDYIISISGRMGFVEVKAGDTNLPMNTIEDSQREWYKLTHQLSGAWYGLFFMLGFPEEDERAFDYPKAAYLLSWPQWLAIEEVYKPTRKSIPYNAPELAQYSLIWVKGKGWDFPEGHPFIDYFEVYDDNIR